MYKVIINHGGGHVSTHRVPGNSVSEILPQIDDMLKSELTVPLSISYVPVLSDREIDTQLRKDML